MAGFADRISEASIETQDRCRDLYGRADRIEAAANVVFAQATGDGPADVVSAPATIATNAVMPAPF